MNRDRQAQSKHDRCLCLSKAKIQQNKRRVYSTQTDQIRGKEEREGETFANLQVMQILWWRSGPGSCSFEPDCSCRRRTASVQAGGPCESHRPSCNDGPSV